MVAEVSGRKIVQIATMPAGEAGPEIQAASFIALCDDGTVWVLPNEAVGTWEQLPPIPQPEPLLPVNDSGALPAGWQPIATAPRDGTEIACCWVGRHENDTPREGWVRLAWKINRRIVESQMAGHDLDLSASYFGDPDEDDDFDIATSQPTHWFLLPAIASADKATP